MDASFVQGSQARASLTLIKSANRINAGIMKSFLFITVEKSFPFMSVAQSSGESLTAGARRFAKDFP
jgi:hypothetical protein